MELSVRGKKDEGNRRHLERRRFPRHSVTSAATLIREGQPPRLCWVKNLSPAGALLFGGDRLRNNDRVHLLLHLPWYQPIAVEGKVVHMSRRGAGVTFDESSSARVAIERAIDAAEQCECQLRSPAVLVLTDREEVQQSMERDLALLDMRCVTAETPLDAIRWLQSWDTVIELVIVDIAFEQANVLSFLRFLAEEFPRVRRIVIVDGELPTLEKVAYTFGRCSAVLERPWAQDNLQQLVSPY